MSGEPHGVATVDHPGPPGEAAPFAPSRHRWPIAELLVGAIMGVVALVPIANAWDPSLPFDDAYIAFAYALHLATGHGLVLSTGTPPVEAYSDPLWVVIMAAGHWLGLTIPTWSNIVNIGLVAVLAGTTMRLVRRLAPSAPLWTAAGAGVVVALLPAVAYYAVGGLETLLFTALFNVTVLWFLTDCERGRPLSPATSGWCLLVALTRPEGLVLWAVVWALTWVWSRDVRRQSIAAAWFLVPAVLLETGRLLYFDQVLPNSIVAKSGLPWSVAAQLARTESWQFFQHYFPALIVASVVVVASLGRRLLPRTFRYLAVVAVVMTMVEVAASSGDNYPYERYLFVVVPLTLVLAVAGIAHAGWSSSNESNQLRTRRVTDGRARRDTVAAWVAAACLLVVLGASLGAAFGSREASATTGQDLNLSRGWSQLHFLFSPDTLSKHSGRYHFALAAVLNRTQPPGTSIALTEIGTVAYYTRLRVIDLWGLADTRIARRPGLPGARSAPHYVFSRRPTGIVLGFTGCLCLVFHSDLAYAGAPQMLGYELTRLVYVSSPPGALLYERQGRPTTLTSLDDSIPGNARRVTAMPGPLRYSIDVQTYLSVVLFHGATTPELRAAGVLAVRAEFVAMAPGTTTSVPIDPTTDGTCTVHLTGLSYGSSPQGLSAVVTTMDGRPLAAASPALGARPTIETSRLTFPARAHRRLLLSTSATSQAEWAEPFLTCQAA